MHVPLKDGIDWVGFVDWNIRDFHGYHTPRGTTYNAYLVRDDKTALVDTVRGPFAASLIDNIRALIDPPRVDYVVCNHAETDHAGGLPSVLASCPNAQVVCDARCREALGMHFDTAGWKFNVVADGQELPLGRRSLKFLEMPMVHWPESMFTYVPQDKLLLPNDAFGQHLATSGRFDDEEDLDVILTEAKSYYANILMLYGQPIGRALAKAGALPIEMIAPSHGVIWRKNLGAIMSAYKDWVALKPSAKVVVIYDTMWKSTERMAQAIADGAGEAGAQVKLLWVRANDEAVIATEVLDAACIAFGSPTLNNGLMPRAAAILTYLKGLKPAGKSGFAFGAYGWAKGATAQIEEYLKAMRIELVREPLLSHFAPKADVLESCRQAGRLLGERALQAAGTQHGRLGRQ